MKKYLLTMALVAFAMGAMPSLAADINNEEEEADWVCFAKDYADTHEKDEPETEDCIHAYHRGEGICLSHAKKRAMARCLNTPGSNKSTCKLDKFEDCFLANAVEPKPKPKPNQGQGQGSTANN